MNSQKIYARAMLLRNCGRFLNISSDYGSDYKTHPFLTAEMLHAGMSRERGRSSREFVAAFDDYDFFRDFDVGKAPLWFTPATLCKEDEDGIRYVSKSRMVTDRNLFNSLKESDPGIQDNNLLPKYGSMESIIAGQQFYTVGFSPKHEELDSFTVGQTFVMGKKRTMFQIALLSSSTAGEQIREQVCRCDFVQVQPRDVTFFSGIEVLAATRRYLVLRGETKPVAALRFHFDKPFLGEVLIPEFVLQPFLDQLGLRSTEK